MKPLTRSALISICVLFAGCRNDHDQNVVKQTYIHKYGVPVAKSDWENQGKEGKIIQLRKDGITLAQTFSNGILNGETSYTFPQSSTIHFLETYANGVLIAKKENYPFGVPFREEVFNEEGQLVQLTKWYEDGTPLLVESYCEGRLLSGEYRSLLHVLEAKVQNGHGTRLLYSIGGELCAKESFESGDCVERVTYFANGDPSAVIPFDGNGKIHGTYLTFLQGGLPDTVAQWEHGQPQGLTIFYQNGEKIAAVPYFRGQKHGVERRFRDGVILVEEICWENNHRHGPHYLHLDGATKTDWYFEGELVSHMTFEKLQPIAS